MTDINSTEFVKTCKKRNRVKNKITAYFNTELKSNDDFSCEMNEKQTKHFKAETSTNCPMKTLETVCRKKEIFTLGIADFSWKSITSDNLNLKYSRIFSKQTASNIFERLENEVEYFTGEHTKVKVFGKMYNIPRKQVAFGETGLSYAFSGTSIPAIPWGKCNIVFELKKVAEQVSGHHFNFVLINRYKDGNDHMGEHRDDEKELVACSPIASLSFGQNRDFIFRHKDARGKIDERKPYEPIKLELEHGSLLLMEWPTNRYWYHSLPVRKKANNVRINLTFRELHLKH